MPVPSLITDLSTTAASNSPAGSESARGTIDDYLRAHASFIATLRDGKQASLGYTPVNKTGDTMTGPLTITGGRLSVGTTSNFSANNQCMPTATYNLGVATGTWNNVGNAVDFYSNMATTPVLSGSVALNGNTTSYTSVSDYRLKDNSQALTGSGAFIDALQPKTWTWKSDGTAGVGFIAHEVAAVSPRSVNGEKDAVNADGSPKYQSMEYGSAEFVANIVAELQSLRARVAALEGQP